MAAKNKFLILYFSFFAISARCENVKNVENSISINGLFYKASLVAYSEFNQKIKADYKGSSEIEKYMSDIVNYDIKISEAENQLIVLFVLHKSKKFAVFGSGGEYFIDKKDFNVVKRIFQE